MAVKSILVFCASALLVQSAYSACVGGLASPYGFAGNGWGYNGLAGPALAYEGCGAPGLAYEGFGAPALAYEGFGAPALAYEGFGAPALAYEGFGAAGFGCGYGGVASTGGGLACASASPVPPVGVSLVSENVYEGALAAGGNMPFLGTVDVKGVLPTAGAGAVSYGCGNSNCAVGVEEGPIATGIAPHAPGPYAAYGPYGSGLAGTAFNGFNGIGYGLGYGIGYGSGCGCGAIY